MEERWVHVMVILGKERKKLNSTEVQSNHNRRPKPQQNPLPYDHRAVWFIWQEVPILITVIISTPPVFMLLHLCPHMSQRSGYLTVCGSAVTKTPSASRGPSVDTVRRLFKDPRPASPSEFSDHWAVWDIYRTPPAVCEWVHSDMSLDHCKCYSWPRISC